MEKPVRDALVISWSTVVWSGITGVLSIVLGLQAASLALLGSGASVLVDVTSSLVLVWRFRHPHGNERAEHRAQLVASTALLVLATLLAASSVERLVTGGTVHPGPMTVGVAAASLVVLPLLAARKYAVAAAVPSAALRTDAHITVVGASTAGLALLGFVLTEAGASWADPVAALLVAVAAAAVGLYERRS